MSNPSVRLKGKNVVHPALKDGSLEQFHDRRLLQTGQQGLWQTYERSVYAYMNQHFREMARRGR